MKKIAIIGASYLQKPLVTKANEYGLETYVFAWSEGNVASDIATKFFDISITEKEEILQICRKLQIDGIVSVGSDIAVDTVNYVAEALNLVGNPYSITKCVRDKYEMRKALSSSGLLSPKFLKMKQIEEVKMGELPFNFPIVVKPNDRSGSRGVIKLSNSQEFIKYANKAKSLSLSGTIVVEEYIDTYKEFSIEMLSYKGEHYYLSATDKVKTKEPFFVEMELHQPAAITLNLEDRIKTLVKTALDILGVKNGASHVEVILTPDDELYVVEVAARMAGDLIGSHLIELSTGFDFLKAVIEISLGIFNINDYKFEKKGYAGAVYLAPNKDGVVHRIVDHSAKFEDIVDTFVFIKKNDVVTQIVDGADKRIGAFVYFNKDEKKSFGDNEIIDIKIKEV